MAYTAKGDWPTKTSMISGMPISSMPLLRLALSGRWARHRWVLTTDPALATYVRMKGNTCARVGMSIAILFSKTLGAALT
jgi:hypothetical protein